MQGARIVPVQLNCAQGKVAIGFDGNASPATRSGGQSVSALGLESAGNGYTATFQTDGSARSAPTALGVVGGGIPTIGEDFSSGSNSEGTIPMGKQFHCTPTGSTAVRVSTTASGTTK